MKILFSVFLVLFLAACTSVETYHNACIEGNATISSQVSCVKANILQDDLLKDDTLAQEYIRTGDLLVKRVAEGKMSEEEAQLKFVKTLNRVRRDELRERAYQATIDRANRDTLPRETVCEERSDGRLYCRSY